MSMGQIKLILIVLSIILLIGYSITLVLGVSLHLTGITIFSRKYDELGKYRKFSYNAVTVTIIAFIVILIYGTIYYFKYIY